MRYKAKWSSTHSNDFLSHYFLEITCVVLCLISNHETKCCLSLSYGFTEETAPNSFIAFLMKLMVVGSGTRHLLQCEGDWVGCPSCSRAYTRGAFASAPAYKTAPSRPVPHSYWTLVPPGQQAGARFLPATILVCSTHAPMSRCTNPFTPYLASIRWCLSVINGLI